MADGCSWLALGGCTIVLSSKWCVDSLSSKIQIIQSYKQPQKYKSGTHVESWCPTLDSDALILNWGWGSRSNNHPHSCTGDIVHCQENKGCRAEVHQSQLSPPRISIPGPGGYILLLGGLVIVSDLRFLESWASIKTRRLLAWKAWDENPRSINATKFASKSGLHGEGTKLITCLGLKRLSN